MLLARAALLLAILSAILAGTIWLVFLGAPLAFVSLGMGIVAARRARTTGHGRRTALAAIVISVLAILALPLLLVACNSVTSCV